MPRKIAKPRIKYVYEDSNSKALDRAYAYLFNKVMEQYNKEKTGK